MKFVSVGLIAAFAAAVNAQKAAPTAVAAAATAANAACSAPTSGTLVIQSQGDAAVLAGCTTYTGNVEISTLAAGQINLPGVQQITGEVIVNGATGVTSLSADSLMVIGDSFTLNNLTNLQSISFPYLTACGNVNFQGLPNLAALGFNKMLSTVGTLSIQNTFLADLTGLNVTTVSSIYIANNRMLQSMTFLVPSVPNAIVVEANGDKYQALFPNLETAQNITFRGASVISIPSLINVTGSLGFYENNLATIVAPNLTAVGQTLAVNTNPLLTNVSFPVLTSIGGGIQVQNNTQLTSVSLPELQTIGGALDFYGNFTSVTIPNLKDCRGGFNIQSSSTSLDCSVFNGEHGSNSVIKGTYKCSGSVSNPGNINSNPSSGSGGSSSTKGNAIAIGVPSNSLLLGLAGALAAVMYTL